MRANYFRACAGVAADMQSLFRGAKRRVAEQFYADAASEEGSDSGWESAHPSVRSSAAVAATASGPRGAAARHRELLRRARELLAAVREEESSSRRRSKVGPSSATYRSEGDRGSALRPELEKFSTAVSEAIGGAFREELDHVVSSYAEDLRKCVKAFSALIERIEGMVGDGTAETGAPRKPPSGGDASKRRRELLAELAALPEAVEKLGARGVDAEEVAAKRELLAHAASGHSCWPAIDASRLPFVRRMQGATNMEASKFMNTGQPHAPSMFPDLEQAMIDVQLPLWLPGAQGGLQPAMLDAISSTVDILVRLSPDMAADMRPVLEEVAQEKPKKKSKPADAHGAPPALRLTAFVGAGAPKTAAGGSDTESEEALGKKSKRKPSSSVLHMATVLKAGGCTPKRVIAVAMAATNDGTWKSVEKACKCAVDDTASGWAMRFINRVVQQTSLKFGRDASGRPQDPLQMWLFHGAGGAGDDDEATYTTVLNMAMSNKAEGFTGGDFDNIRTALRDLVTSAVEKAGGMYTNVLMRKLKGATIPRVLRQSEEAGDLADIYRELVSLEMRLSDMRTLRSIESGMDRVRRTRVMEAARSMLICAWRTRVAEMDLKQRARKDDTPPAATGTPALGPP